jgi:phosphoribosylformylglycinamidine (FGAM) synthase PurS component
MPDAAAPSTAGPLQDSVLAVSPAGDSASYAPGFCSRIDETTKRRTSMKTYSVLYAEDVPHYGSMEIAAENDAEAIAKAQAISEEDLGNTTIDPVHSNSVCKRIVHIEDPEGKHIAADIPLDGYTLIHGEDKRRLSESAPQLSQALAEAIEALKRIAEITHYENGEPVTALESREIETIYADAAGQLEDFEAILKTARRNK